MPGSKAKSPEVEIRYLGLAKLVAGSEKDVVPWPGEGTIKELLDVLCDRYGREFRSSIFTMKGTLQNCVRIEVDGADIDDLQGLQTSFLPSAKIKFIVTVPSLAGG